MPGSSEVGAALKLAGTILLTMLLSVRFRRLVAPLPPCKGV